MDYTLVYKGRRLLYGLHFGIKGKEVIIWVILWYQREGGYYMGYTLV